MKKPVHEAVVEERPDGIVWARCLTSGTPSSVYAGADVAVDETTGWTRGMNTALDHALHMLEIWGCPARHVHVPTGAAKRCWRLVYFDGIGVGHWCALPSGHKGECSARRCALPSGHKGECSARQVSGGRGK